MFIADPYGPLAGGLPTINVPRLQFAHYERAIRDRVHGIIQQKYPGHPFEVSVSLYTLLVTVTHPLLPEGVAIVVKLDDEDPEGHIYWRLCGELLERYNLPRGGIDLIAGVEITEDDQAKALSDIK